MAFSCVDEDWNPSWLVTRHRYLESDHRFKMWLRMLYKVFGGWHNVKNFSVTPADSGGLQS